MWYLKNKNYCGSEDLYSMHSLVLNKQCSFQDDSFNNTSLENDSLHDFINFFFNIWTAFNILKDYLSIMI